MSMNIRRSWPKYVLQMAGVYNLLWGAWVVIFPLSFFHWAEMPEPLYPTIWQSVGMIVGVYGLGYYLAARNPIQHYPIVLVGFLGKVFGPLGILYYYALDLLDGAFFWVTLCNDLIWLPFFGAILYQTLKAKTGKPTTET